MSTKSEATHSCNDERSSETEPFIESTNVRRRRFLQRTPVLPWIISTSISTVAAVLLLVLLLRSPSFGTFENGFTTELGPPSKLIEVEQIKFTGGLFYDANGTLYRNTDPTEPQYFGPPSAELDGNWEKLVRGRYPPFKGSELRPSSREAAHQNPETGMYNVGADSLHTLHCINKIRMAIDKYYYNDDHDQIGESPAYKRLHLEHCMDYLRQVIQCSADTTPLPVFYSTRAQRLIPNFEQVHTCRKFSNLRQWADERSKIEQSEMKVELPNRKAR